MTKIMNTLSNIELEKAKNTIDQFLYSCSHSLRSPLKSIEGLLVLLKMSAAQHDSQEISTLIHALGSSIKKMDNTLLGMHEFLQNSNNKIHLRPVLISELTRSTVSEISQLAGKEKIKVDIHVIEEVAIYTDVARFQIALRHVLQNAFTFTDDSKPEQLINISIKVNNLRARISVEDNGIGICDTALPRIFDLFYRGHVQSAGTGIGLYLTKEIVKKLEGLIEVDSEPGIGSTFTISIPNLEEQESH